MNKICNFLRLSPKITVLLLSMLSPLQCHNVYCWHKFGQKIQIFWYSGLLRLISTQIHLIWKINTFIITFLVNVCKPWRYKCFATNAMSKCWQRVQGFTARYLHCIHDMLMLHLSRGAAQVNRMELRPVDLSLNKI